MSLTDRDRKLLAILIPVVLLGAYWMLLLGPQRSELASAQDQRSQAESARDEAQAKIAGLEQSRRSYATDYAAVVRLGKAIPTTLDTPSLLVQLETAAKGTKIRFDRITAGPRTSASADGAASSGGSAPPVAAGGEQAQSGAGKQVEKANDAAQTSEDANAAAGADPGTAGSGGGQSAAGSPDAALDTVPLNFTFTGSFFDLADFLHQVKRFVRVANSGKIDVKGRLMTIDGISFDSESFPSLKAEITATAYLAPKEEGTTGGATPQGPAAAPSTATPATSPGAPPAADNASSPAEGTQ